VYRIVIISLSLSICFASDDIQSRMDKLMKSLQEKYQIYSPEDLHKLTSRSNTNNRSFSSSDMDDLFGEWFVEAENYEMYVTVGSDQSIPNMMQMTAIMEAEGNITATASDYETELTYMLNASMLEMDNGDDDDDDDDNYTYGPRIGMYLTDLDPGDGGAVYFDETDTQATITFVDVPLFDDSDALNTFQVQLIYSSGEIIISYKDLSLTGSNTEQAPGGLAIGIANGEGDYDEVDLSESAGESYSFPVEGYSDSNELDLAYKQITFTPNSDFSEYSVSATTITDLPASYSNEITVDDDDYTEQSLSSYFEFYGNSYNQIYINNDGNIGFEDGDETCVCWVCDDGDGDCAAAYLSGESNIDNDPLFVGEDDYNAASVLIYAQNYTALIFAQDYVDDYSSNHGQSSFELDSVFNLVIDGDDVSGGLGGDNPGNCEINWPEDPYRMAVYSFVSEYVLSEGASVGCFVDDVTLDQTFAYVALEMESLWSGGDDGDDDSEDLFIMNFGFLDFFLFMFGMPPEGVDNPLMVMINFEEEIVAAQGLTAFGQDPDIYIADPSDFESSVSFDMDEQTLIITELSLMDSTETAVLSLNGTIGPGMIDLVAGVSTEIPGLDMEILGEELEAPEVYMVFHEDSTGMIIEIEEDEDYGDMIDTSYFDWFATSDSLWLFEDEWICDGGEGYTDSFSSEEECNEECNTDCYYDEDNDGMAIYYEFSDDTLFISVTEYPCEDFNDYDECIEEGEMDLFIGELEDIQDFYIHNTLVMLPTGDDVSLADVTVMPEKFTLHQNYPNPFNPVTTLRYDLPENGNVNITIYDMLGRQVKTLINQNQDAGYRSVVWNATNNYGEPVSAGIYLYQIQAGEYMQTKKMVLLK